MPSFEDPTKFYGPEQRDLQTEFDSTTIADVHLVSIVTDTISDDQRDFIQARDYFYLSTVDPNGWPTVSYKGGPTGVVQVLDERTISFPFYDGNGMFLSAGNVAATAKIGLLFIDMEVPNRLRVHATARIAQSEAALSRFPGAEIVIEATVDNIFLNCGRYIHPHKRIESSKYVPDAEGKQPFASWKRVDVLQPFLPGSDQGRAAKEGGEITLEEYTKRVEDGTS